MKNQRAAIVVALFSACSIASCAKTEAPPAAAAEPAPLSVASGPEPAVEAAVDLPATENATENAVMACPVLDSRNWAAWTTPDGNGHTLHIEGEIDMPTPGYALTWSPGPADRAFPPGLRLRLDAAAPDGVVMQVVTPTPVSYDLAQASPDYRTVIVLCGGEAIAEIAPVTAKAG